MNDWWHQPKLELNEIVSRQSGYFSGAQATLAGFNSSDQKTKLTTGEWLERAENVYRLATSDPLPKEEWMVLFLSSCNDSGQPAGVFGYESAMQLFALSCQKDSKVHLFVPSQFEPIGNAPGYVIFHKCELKPEETTTRWSVPTTTPLRTIVDLLVRGRNDRTLLRLGLSEALSRQLFTQQDMERANLNDKERELLNKLVAELPLVDVVDQGIG